MKELKVLSYVFDGRLGGRKPEVWQYACQAIDDGVDVVAAQGGGMDPGPYYLGWDGIMPFSAEMAGPMFKKIRQKRVPFVISMGGAAGADIHLEQYLDVIDEICRSNNIKIKAAVVSGEIDKQFIIDKIRKGVKIRRSIATPRLSEYLTEEDVQGAKRIQSQMGPEPIMKYLDKGVDGVFTGRATDVGIQLAYPLKQGFAPSVAAHMAKCIECGSMICEPTGPFESVLATLREDHFLVRPNNPNLKCTVNSVSSHGFYEREDPNLERNPAGILDVSQARYEQIDNVTVRVSGGKWIPTPYTVKLEGAQSIGFQTSIIAAIREPAMIEQIDSIMGSVKDIVAHIPDYNDVKYEIKYFVFGRDGILGQHEPLRNIAKPHEVAVLINVIAPTQEGAHRVADSIRVQLFMAHYPGRRTTAGNMAVPMQPGAFDMGERYMFSIWHIMPLDDPVEPFKTRVITFPRK